MTDTTTETTIAKAPDTPVDDFEAKAKELEAMLDRTGKKRGSIALITGNIPPYSHCGSADYSQRLFRSVDHPEMELAYLPLNESFKKRLASSNVKTAKIIHFQALSWDLNKKQVFLPFLVRFLNPRAKIVATLHEWDSLKPLLRVGMYPFPLLAKHLIFVSRSERAAFLNHPINKILRKKTTWIPIGCNLDVPDFTKEEIDDFRRNVVMKDLDPDTKVVVHFGWIYRTKQPETMLEMVRLAKEKGEKVKLFMVGDFHAHHPDRRAAFVQSIKDQGLEDDVKILGFIEDNRLASLWLAASDGQIALYLDGLSMRRGSFWVGCQIGRPIITTELQTPEEFGEYETGLVAPHVNFLPKGAAAPALLKAVEALPAFEAKAFPKIRVPDWETIGKEHRDLYRSLGADV
jgi:glycosyltransferase involved in cell wall biosynthesis